MFNVIVSLVIAVSGIWIYLDATKNEIGKIEGEKGMFNMSAGAWAIVTLLLWIIGFPAYLIKRKSLIEKSIDNPVNVSGKWVKVAGLAVIGLLLVAAPLAPFLSQFSPSLPQQYEGVWKDKDGKIAEVHLTGDNVGLLLGGTHYPLTILGVDADNKTISVVLSGSKGDQQWTIKGESDSSNDLTLKFTDQNGEHFKLFFVSKFPDSSPVTNNDNSSDYDGEVSCTDEEAKRLVLEMTYEKLFEQLLPSHIQKNHSVLLADLEDKPVFEKYREKVTVKILESNNNLLFQEFLAVGGLTTDLPPDYFIEFTKVSPVAAKIFEDITQQIKGMGVSLDAIRVRNNRPDIKKVSCEADIQLSNGTNGTSLPIQYTVQFTEDGQIYVEVSGL